MEKTKKKKTKKSSKKIKVFQKEAMTMPHEVEVSVETKGAQDGK